MASNYSQDGQIPIPPRRTRSSTSEKVIMAHIYICCAQEYSVLLRVILHFQGSLC